MLANPFLVPQINRTKSKETKMADTTPNQPTTSGKKRAAMKKAFSKLLCHKSDSASGNGTPQPAILQTSQRARGKVYTAEAPKWTDVNAGLTDSSSPSVVTISSATPKPQPTTTEPQPATTEPQLATTEPQPATAGSKDAVTEPQETAAAAADEQSPQEDTESPGSDRAASHESAGPSEDNIETPDTPASIAAEENSATNAASPQQQIEELKAELGRAQAAKDELAAQVQDLRTEAMRQDSKHGEVTRIMRNVLSRQKLGLQKAIEEKGGMRAEIKQLKTLYISSNKASSLNKRLEITEAAYDRVKDEKSEAQQNFRNLQAAIDRLVKERDQAGELRQSLEHQLAQVRSDRDEIAGWYQEEAEKRMDLARRLLDEEEKSLDLKEALDLKTAEAASQVDYLINQLQTFEDCNVWSLYQVEFYEHVIYQFQSALDIAHSRRRFADRRRAELQEQGQQLFLDLAEIARIDQDPYLEHRFAMEQVLGFAQGEVVLLQRRLARQERQFSQWLYNYESTFRHERRAHHTARTLLRADAAARRQVEQAQGFTALMEEGAARHQAEQVLRAEQAARQRAEHALWAEQVARQQAEDAQRILMQQRNLAQAHLRDERDPAFQQRRARLQRELNAEYARTATRAAALGQGTEQVEATRETQEAGNPQEADRRQEVKEETGAESQQADEGEATPQKEIGEEEKEMEEVEQDGQAEEGTGRHGGPGQEPRGSFLTSMGLDSASSQFSFSFKP